MDNPDAHWRDSARQPRFFGVDYRALFPLLVLLFLPRLWTLILALVSIVFFVMIGHYGFSVTVFLRWLRGVFAGSYKASRPWWLKRL